MRAKSIMIQGTGSSVGKSLLTAALCRIFTQDGHRVLPFKAQNMSNNAYVTKDGGEIGRAQAEQAMACRIEPSVLVNPVLLKPTTDLGAQVIVLGKPIGTMTAQAYQAFKPQLLSTITRALDELRGQADVLVIEGAGSPAEINLKASDVVNMWIAKHARAKVLLVGDIDRGGVFAHLAGTMELLDEDERQLVRGFVINKFRGDPTLLASGLQWLETRYKIPVVGVLPYLHDVELLEEDGITRDASTVRPREGRLSIEVIHLPRIGNVTDFAPLEREPDAHLRYIDRPLLDSLPDGLIVPGSKSTVADLGWMRERGFDRYLARCAEAGREIVGVCGGFQMLGQRILDPDHLEAAVDAADGLGFLPSTTVFEKDKCVAQVRGLHRESGLPVAGYEIHMGRMRDASAGMPAAAQAGQPLLTLTERGGKPDTSSDGLSTPDGLVWGTHVHGLFDAPDFRRWWLNRLRRRRGLPDVLASPSSNPDDAYDRLAAVVRPHLNLETLYRILES